MIPRVEAVDADKAIAKARATKQKSLVRSSEAYMHTAVWQYGSQISMLTDGPDVLDVPEDWVSVAPAEQRGGQSEEDHTGQGMEAKEMRCMRGCPQPIKDSQLYTSWHGVA